MRLKGSQGLPLCPGYDMRMHNHTAKYVELQLILKLQLAPFWIHNVPNPNNQSLKLTDTWYVKLKC